MKSPSTELFGSRTRAALLKVLFVDAIEASESVLARLAGVDTRGVRDEVARLVRLGLVSTRAEGSRVVVSANSEHPVHGPLRDLLRAAASAEAGHPGRSSSELHETLAAYGAPLFVVRRSARVGLEEAILQGLDAARTEPIVLRVLPIVLAKNRDRIDWVMLVDEAKRRRLGSELGMVAELTTEVTGDSRPFEAARHLHDGRRRATRYLPEDLGRFGKELAEERTPEIASRWGFRVNLSLESLRDLARKHLA